MKKIALMILIGLLLPMAIAGKGKTSNWYFGQGAGITPVTGGKLNTCEGCATISDINGNMLFYTDGITVIDRNHALMAFGTGLYRDLSKTQSTPIVPKPEAPFTQLQVAVMDCPEFFTPNGDGVSDYWQVTGLDRQFQANTSNSMYDRYGDLVTRIGRLGRYHSRWFPSLPRITGSAFYRMTPGK